MKPVQFLLRYVKQRENSYKFYPQKSLAKLAAITKIKKYCQQYKKEEKTAWIQGIKNEIILILPGEDSPFQSLRNEALELIESINNN